MLINTSIWVKISGAVCIFALLFAEVIHYHIDDPANEPPNLASPDYIRKMTFTYPTIFISVSLALFPGRSIGILFVCPAATIMAISFVIRSDVNDPAYKWHVALTLSAIAGTFGVMAFPYTESMLLHLIAAFTLFIGVSGMIAIDKRRCHQFSRLSTFQMKVIDVLGASPQCSVVVMLIALTLMHWPGFDPYMPCFIAAIAENTWFYSSMLYLIVIYHYQPLLFNITAEKPFLRNSYTVIK